MCDEGDVMKRKLIFIVIVIYFSTGIFCESFSIKDLNFLKGYWKGEVGKNSFEVFYTDSKGGVILSSGKEFKADGSLAFFEYEKFKKKGKDIFMVPYINGKEACSFRLISLKSRTAVFVNPQNDFPSRIVYKAVGRDKLQIILTGAEKSIESKVVYKLSRSDL